MCQIVNQAKNPKAGSTYTIKVTGKAPVNIDWAITGGSSGSGTVDPTPGGLDVDIPAGSGGQALSISITCDDGGSDGTSVNIDQ